MSWMKEYEKFKKKLLNESRDVERLERLAAMGDYDAAEVLRKETTRRDKHDWSVVVSEKYWDLDDWRQNIDASGEFPPTDEKERVITLIIPGPNEIAESGYSLEEIVAEDIIEIILKEGAIEPSNSMFVSGTCYTGFYRENSGSRYDGVYETEIFLNIPEDIEKIVFNKITTGGV